MKKYIMLFILPLTILLSSCSPSKTPVKNPPPSKELSRYTISDYYPFRENIKMSYLGNGSEYASQDIYFDFIKGDTAQIRMVNPGTTIGRIIENKNGELSVLKSREEFFYKDNLSLLNNTSFDKEVLLKEPLILGNAWPIPNGARRTITNTAANVATPYGIYKALEVTTESADYRTKDYYALNIGLIKSVFFLDNSEISSSLEKIDSNAYLVQDIKLFYPEILSNDMRLVFTNIKIPIKTNGEIKNIFQKYFANPPKNNLTPLISKSTKINKLYLNPSENKVYIDFSNEFIDEMNLGSSVELSVINSITSTLGNYYNVNKVYITVNDSPYTSGHIALDQGESFTVDSKNSVELK